LFNAKIEKGTEYILNLSGFYSIAEQCDVIITGEGIFDNTSFSGKVTGEIIKFAEKMNKHAFLICAKKYMTLELNLSKLTILELNFDYSRNKNLNADTYFT
jgi:glycerate kinase